MTSPVNARRSTPVRFAATRSALRRRPAAGFFSRPLVTVVAVFLAAGVLAGGLVGVVTFMQQAGDAQQPIDDPVARGPGEVRPGELPAEPDDPPVAPLPAGLDTRIPQPTLPPKVPLKRYAVTPVPITPATLAGGQVSVTLPGIAGESCVGGGGRFLILHVPAKRQLAVFDVSAAKVVKVLPLAADAVHFAAGMTKLFVAYPDAALVVRYDLLTQTKEATLPLPVPGRLNGLSMGHASAGPLLVTYQQDLPFKSDAFGGRETDAFLLDPFTLARYDVAGFDVRDPRQGPGLQGTQQLGPDGTVLVGSGTFGPSVRLLTEKGVQFLPINRMQERGGRLLPGPDGTFHTASGRLDRTGKPLGGGAAFCLPAAHGSLYLQTAYREVGRKPLEGLRYALDVNVHTPDLAGPLFRYPVTSGTEPAQVGFGGRTGPDPSRFLFVPDAHVLVVLAPGNETLVLHEFRLQDAMESQPDGTLFVLSRPGLAKAGAAFAYQIAAISKNGGVTF